MGDRSWPPQPGHELVPRSWPSGLETWNRFAAVSDEFYATHYDDEAGRAAGFPSAIGFGDLEVAYFNNLLRDWLGPRGAIRDMACRFHSPPLKGSVVTVRGTVTTATESCAEVALTAEDHRGEMLATGTATVTYFPGGDA